MKIKNVIGKKYGKLTILDDIKNKDKRQRILITKVYKNKNMWKRIS